MKHLMKPVGLAVLGCALTVAVTGTSACAASASSDDTRAVSRDMFRMYASGGHIGGPRGKGNAKNSGNFYNRGRSVNSGNFANAILARDSNNSYNSANNANGPQRIVVRRR